MGNKTSSPNNPKKKKKNTKSTLSLLENQPFVPSESAPQLPLPPPHLLHGRKDSQSPRFGRLNCIESTRSVAPLNFNTKNTDRRKDGKKKMGKWQNDAFWQSERESASVSLTIKHLHPKNCEEFLDVV